MVPPTAPLWPPHPESRGYHRLVAAPLALLLPLAVVLVALGLFCLVTARAGWIGTLRRQGRLGVHTPAALASEDAFATANRVAAPVIGGAAVVGLLLGILLIVLQPPTLAAIVMAVIGVVGTLGLLFAGGVLGEKAARTVPIPARRPTAGPNCGGCDCSGGGCAVSKIPRTMNQA